MTLIQFNTAKLAKEKGFNIEYNLGHIIKHNLPTQSELQKWLRDYHNIHININYYGDHEDGHSCFRGEVVQHTIGQSVTRKSILSNIKEDAYVFKSYEKALEKSLYEALKLIKDDNN